MKLKTVAPVLQADAIEIGGYHGPKQDRVPFVNSYILSFLSKFRTAIFLIGIATPAAAETRDAAWEALWAMDPIPLEGSRFEQSSQSTDMTVWTCLDCALVSEVWLEQRVKPIGETGSTSEAGYVVIAEPCLLGPACNQSHQRQFGYPYTYKYSGSANEGRGAFQHFYILEDTILVVTVIVEYGTTPEPYFALADAAHDYIASRIVNAQP